jgi:hypothetical protein
MMDTQQGLVGAMTENLWFFQLILICHNMILIGSDGNITVEYDFIKHVILIVTDWSVEVEDFKDRVTCKHKNVLNFVDKDLSDVNERVRKHFLLNQRPLHK